VHLPTTNNVYLNLAEFVNAGIPVKSIETVRRRSLIGINSVASPVDEEPESLVHRIDPREIKNRR